MMKKKVLALLLAVSLFASSVCTGYAVEPNSEIHLENLQEIETNVTEIDSDEFTTDLTLDEPLPTEQSIPPEDASVPVIITFKEDSIIEDNADAVMNFLNEWKIKRLENKQKSVIKKIEKEVLDGDELDIAYQYTWLLNGIATEIPYGMIDEIESIKNVEKVILQTTYETCENTGTGNTISSMETTVSSLNEYDGQGTKIAIIDTGIDETHPSFSALDESQLAEHSMTLAKVNSVFEQLNAYQKYENYYGEKLSSEEVYRNSKIPFGFSYAQTNSGIGHYDGDDHGTHVAGIAAANNYDGAEMCGVAPAAQLYVMKVFNEGFSFTEDILAAVEDSMILGADVINMSLGKKSGFSSDGEYLDEIYGRVSETGTLLVVAAGNDGTSGNGNNWNYGLSLSSNPDNGTVGSPGTYINALTVANADCTSDEISINWSSSWGPSPNLSLEPDIIAPGTEIYSATNNGTYGIKSGTSMASPYIAGVAALMVQQLQESTPDLTTAERFDFINSLLMSTAEPIAYEEDIYWSPRSQGSGMINLTNALNASSSLSVPSMDVPKVELKDDPEKTGRYHYEFSVNNFGNTTAYYDVNTVTQTEQIIEHEGLTFMSGNPVALDALIQTESKGLFKTLDYTSDDVTCTTDARQLYLKLQHNQANDSEESFRYDLDKNNAVTSEDVQKYLDTLTGKTDIDLDQETLKVEPGKDESISVSIEVTEAGKAYMDNHFENGIYVEGYTFLNALNANTSDLSLPYMGFYGNWTNAPVFDDGYYWEDPKESGANFTLNEIYTEKNDYMDWHLGMNPYIEEAFDTKYISLSPNEDGNADSVSRIKLSLLRNVNLMTVTFEDENGQCYYEYMEEKIRKSGFQEYYSSYPYYSFTDKNGEYLPNNTKVTMKIELTLDYEHGKSSIWELPITIDTEAPEASDITVLADGNKQYVRMKVSDNIGVAAICLLDETETSFTKYASDKDKATTEEYQYFDITGVGDNFYIVLGDYAFNQNVYKVETTGNEYEINESALYGYRIADETCTNNECYGWLDINQQNAATKVIHNDSMQNLSAAEYVDGHVMGIDTNGNLVAFEFGKWNDVKHISWISNEISDMAYDPETKLIYAYDLSEYSLITIDPVTGDCERISNDFVDSIVAMTCSDTGTLYAITREGMLKTIDKTNGTLSEETLLDTGLAPSRQQSMTYDKNQNCIYWTCYEYEWGYETTKGQLIRIDLNNDYAMTKLGTIGGNSQVIGLMMLNDRGAGLFDNVELNSLIFDQHDCMLLSGQNKVIKAMLSPWCSTTDGLEWTSTDTNIVEVSQDGTITGKAAGNAIIQIQKSGTLLDECHVTVLDVQSDLYGFARFEEETSTTSLIKMDSQELHPEVLSSTDQAVTAAESVDGFIYTCDENRNIYKVSDTSTELLSTSEYFIIDMAYDYKTSTMYGIAEINYTFGLVQIDLNNGEISVICNDLYDEQDYSPIYSIAVSTDGTLYMLSASNNICIYDTDRKTAVSLDYMGDVLPSSVLSSTMTYDHVNGGIYIVPQTYRTGLSLWYFDPEHSILLHLGPLNDLMSLKGLFTIK